MLIVKLSHAPGIGPQCDHWNRKWLAVGLGGLDTCLTRTIITVIFNFQRKLTSPSNVRFEFQAGIMAS